jgi:hypothetical protein
VVGFGTEKWKGENHMEVIGQHEHVMIYEDRDANNRHMIKCLDCETYAHAYDISTAKSDLAATPCISDCQNCNSIRDSYDLKPAVPMGDNCNARLHICPNDGRMWWQSNTYFHLWQQVTDPREWEVLLRKQMQGHHHVPFL